MFCNSLVLTISPMHERTTPMHFTALPSCNLKLPTDKALRLHKHVPCPLALRAMRTWHSTGQCQRACEESESSRWYKSLCSHREQPVCIHQEPSKQVRIDIAVKECIQCKFSKNKTKRNFKFIYMGSKYLRWLKTKLKTNLPKPWNVFLFSIFPKDSELYEQLIF